MCAKRSVVQSVWVAPTMANSGCHSSHGHSGMHSCANNKCKPGTNWCVFICRQLNWMQTDMCFGIRTAALPKCLFIVCTQTRPLSQLHKWHPCVTCALCTITLKTFFNNTSAAKFWAVTILVSCSARPSLWHVFACPNSNSMTSVTITCECILAPTYLAVAFTFDVLHMRDAQPMPVQSACNCVTQLATYLPYFVRFLFVSLPLHHHFGCSIHFKMTHTQNSHKKHRKAHECLAIVQTSAFSWFIVHIII